MAVRPGRARGGARRRCLHSSTIARLIGGANEANARMAGMVLTLTVSDARDHHLSAFLHTLWLFHVW
jgi:hypothetical protein